MNLHVNTAIIATGGYGKRLNPATNAIPKAMLPLGRKPIIQRIVEELRAAGICRIGILCRPEQTTIPEHFLAADTMGGDESPLTGESYDSQKTQDITILPVSDTVSFCHAMLKASEFIGDEPFVLALCDEIDGARSSTSVTSMMIDAYRQFRCSVVPYDRSIVNYSFATRKMPYRIARISALERSPSDLFIVGRFLFANGFLEELARVNQLDNGPAYLAALDVLGERDELVAMPFDTEWWHCGEHLQYQMAFMDYALADCRSASKLEAYLGERMSRIDSSRELVE